MTIPATALLGRFASGPTIEDRWTAARQLMAAKELTSVIDSREFEAGFSAVGDEAKAADGVPRLLAVDLIVRLSNFVKKLKPKAEKLLADALEHELPPTSLISDTKNLPAEAKPAELRENVAVALTQASGEWVLPYILRALAEEDRSQRCRLELARQLAVRDKSVDDWFAKLGEQLSREKLATHSGFEIAVARLRNLSAALADVIRQERVLLAVSEAAGRELARLCRRIVPLPSQTAIPARLGAAAAEVARLLDELFAARLILIVEPDTYAVLEVFQRWWQPLPYPDPLETALQPILDKLVTGITWRARVGQRSEHLALRLRQAVGKTKDAQKMLTQIAATETGLFPEIDDWLRGRSRVSSSTAEALAGALRGVASEDVTVALAPILLDAIQAEASLKSGSSEDLADSLRRLSTRIKAIASQRGLEVVGQPGDVVEYSPSAHESRSGNTPAEPRVRIVRPMVVRRRQDGGQDILVKALVVES